MTTRRAFVRSVALASGAGLLGFRPHTSAAEPPPETTRIRLAWSTTLCFAPQYVAEELLRAEGFTTVEYVRRDPQVPSAVLMAKGEIDLSFGLGPNFIRRADEGDPVVLLAGGHVGCFELFGTRRVRSITDLKGKTVAVPGLGLGPHVFLSIILAHVGLDPRKDVDWRTLPWDDTVRLLAEEKIDAFLGFPPEPQELRARQIGRVVVNTSTDRSWSQYFCCMIAGHRAFVQKHPVATKRALRAILKGADLCATDPDRAARLLVSGGYTRSEYAARVLRDIPYGKWREYNPEDTARFYALRLHEIGMIRSSPQKILSQGTDWRFLNELKKELKG